MEKSTSKDPIQEDLQSQDPELYQEEKTDSGDSQSNRQLLEDEKPTQNVIKQNVLHITEQNERSCSEEEVKQETGINVKQEVEKSAGKSLAPTQSSVQTEADAVHQKCGERVDDEILETERNNIVKQITKNPNEILTNPAQNTITAEYDSNGAALQDLDRIDKNKKLQENAKLQQSDRLKTLSVCDAKEDLQQLFEELEENVKARNEQGVITQEEKATPDKLSESLEGKATLYDAQYQEKMQREEKLKLILAEYFEKINVNQKETENCNQESTNTLNNSKEMEHKSKENVIYGKPEGNWYDNPLELEETSVNCRSESEDHVLEKNQEPEKDTAVHNREAKPECPKPSKDYVTFHDRESNEIIARPQKIKDYVTSHVRNETGEINLQQINGNPEETLTAPKQNSIQMSEIDANDATRQEWDKISENEKLEETVELQQKTDLPRKLSVLYPKLQDLQQPCEVSEENVNVRVEVIAMQEESATPDKVSETQTQTEATQYDLRDQDIMQSEREQKKILTDFYNKQNHAPVQQRIEISKDILIVQEQNPISLSESDSNDAAQQKLKRIAENEEFEANAELHQRSDLPRKHSVFYSKGSLQQPREELKEDVKIRNEQVIIRQEESATPNKLSETLAEGKTTLHNAQHQEKMQQKEELRLIIANFFEKNKVNHQEKDICTPKNTYTFDNSKEKDHHKSEEIAIYKKPECNCNDNLREPGETCIKCRSESKYDLLARFQEQRSDATRCNQDPISETETKLESSKPSKDYVTSHKRITADPQKIKGYITSCRPDRSKTKGYVTLPPQRSEDETVHSNTSKRMSLESQLKGYVTSQPIRQNIIPLPKPPAHVLMRDNSFQRFLSDPGPSTDMHELDPSCAPLGTQQLEEGRDAPRRPLSQQIHLHQNQTPYPEPENDVPFEEMCLNAAIETDELGVKGSETTLRVQTPPQGTEECDFMRGFRRQFFRGIILGLLILLAVIVPLYVKELDSSKFNISDSNFESTLYKFRPILNVPVPDVKQYLQTKSLDSKVNISAAHLIDPYDNFTSTMEGFDANATNSLADLDPEIISMTNNFSDVNTLDNNSESTVTTLMTDVVVKLINFDFRVTTDVNDFDIYAITPVSDFDINAIHPAPELDTDD